MWFAYLWLYYQFLVVLCDHSLTHWGRATHICVSKLTIIALDNGLSPGRRQAIIWKNAGILSIGLLGTKFSEILIEILTFSFKKMRLKVSSAAILPRPQCVKKTPSYVYRNPHYKPKTAWRPSHVYNGNHYTNKQRVLMHGHQGWNVRHGLCHIYMRFVYIYIYIYMSCL